MKRTIEVILEVHILGWAFEANVGEVKAQLERRGKLKIVLQMIRPDTLSEGLKATQPSMLFSPLALPDIDIQTKKNGKGTTIAVHLKGVAVFDRKNRTTDYKRADSGYVAFFSASRRRSRLSSIFTKCRTVVECPKLATFSAIP